MYDFQDKQSRLAPEKVDILATLTVLQTSIGTGVSAMNLSNADFLIQHYVDNNIIGVNLNTGIAYRIKSGKPCFIRPSRGYLRTQLTHPVTHKQIQIRIHRIVGYVIWGYAIFSDSLVIDHIDSNRSNNHPSNLALITQEENIKKRFYADWITVFDVNGNAIAKCKNEDDAKVVSQIHNGKYL